MDFGKLIAKKIELRKDLGIMFFPIYSKHEHEYWYKCRKYTIFGIFDAYEPNKRLIAEFKTGKNYNQSKADGLGQLTLYALMYYKKRKKLPKLLLHWLETEEVDNKVQLTGLMRTFKTERSIAQINEMEERILFALQGIEAMKREVWRELTN